MKTKHSVEPLPATVRRLLAAEEISLREVVRRAGGHVEEGDRRGFPAVQKQAAGTLTATPAVMRFIAVGLRVAPETFAEYRMWKIRHALDPREADKGGVGFEVAVRNLQLLEQAAAGADQPLPAGLLADLQGGQGPAPSATESS